MTTHFCLCTTIISGLLTMGHDTDAFSCVRTRVTSITIGTALKPGVRDTTDRTNRIL